MVYNSLLNAFDISIRRICCRYDEKWLITGTEGGLGILGKGQCIRTKHESAARLENHSFTEICICLEGTFSLQIDEYIFNVDKGDVFLILPGISHNELPKTDCDYTAIWVTTNQNRTALHLSGKKAGGSFYTFDGYTIKSDYEINLILSNLKTEISNKSDFYTEIAKSYILQLLITAKRKINYTTNNRSIDETWKETLVLQVQQYINSNVFRNIKLSDISHEVCISANHLNTIYKSMTGKTIMQYAEAYRIDKAKELLENSHESLASIAEQLGYYDQYHFSKIFKKETGFTPTQFRKL